MVRLLRGLPPRERAAAAASTLAWAGKGEASVLAGELLELAARVEGVEPLAALARSWPRLDGETREAFALVARSRWGELESRVWPAGSAEERRALAALAADLPHPAAAAWLPILLCDTDAGVADAAERGLVALVTGALPATRGRHDAAQAAAAIDTAVARGADSFPEHRRTGALAALLELALAPGGATPGGAARGVMDDEGHAVHGAVRRLIRRSQHPDARVRAWRLLKIESWAAACLDRLWEPMTAPEGTQTGASLLAQVHLLENPGRAARLGRALMRPRKGDRGGLGSPAALLERGTAAGLPMAARCGLARWISAVAAQPREFDRGCVALLSDPSAHVRLALLREAARRAGGKRLLLDLCFDPHPRIAGSAMLHLKPWRRVGMLADDDLDRAVRGAQRSPHARCRRLAREAGGGGECLRCADVRSRLSAREWLVKDREGFLRALRGRLEPGSRSEHEIEAAITTAIVLEVVAEVQEQLEVVLDAAAQWPRAAARAVTALGSLPAGTAIDRLMALLACEQPRVRANAVDALGRLLHAGMGDERQRGEGIRRLKSCTGDDDHRVRASAWRALCRAGRSDGESSIGAAILAGLMAMLRDNRRMHRLAAVWLVDRIAPTGLRDGWGEVAAHLSTMSCSEPEPAVRARAAAAARSLLARFRSQWRDRVAAAAIQDASEVGCA